MTKRISHSCAQFGAGLLGTVFLSFLVMIAIQLVSAGIGRVSYVGMFFSNTIAFFIMLLYAPGQHDAAGQQAVSDGQFHLRPQDHLLWLGRRSGDGFCGVDDAQGIWHIRFHQRMRYLWKAARSAGGSIYRSRLS